MAGNITTFAIRYESKSGAHLYRPGGKVSYSRDEAAAALGRILWAAHCRRPHGTGCLSTSIRSSVRRRP